MHHLIVTADDFGLSHETNGGILEAHQKGIVTSASLLMNAPATHEAVELAKSHPSLEIGIHLGLVEGYSLLGRDSSLTDLTNYFPRAPYPCLHRHWKPFLWRFITGRLDLSELESELTLQCEAFRRAFPDKKEIPFANGTQHLHLLPKIRGIVLKLCRQFGIRYLRAPLGKPTLKRFPYGLIMGILGRQIRREAHLSDGLSRLTFTDDFLGFEASGHVNTEFLRASLDKISQVTATHSQVYELMTHPGYDAPHLRRHLPWAYGDFDWDLERRALTASNLPQLLTENRIKLSQFGEIHYAK